MLKISLLFLFIMTLYADKPNVILIMTDDQGYGDIAVYGNKYIDTPELDKLYHDSVRFTDFHVDPTCAPTRGALMSGKYSHRARVWHTVRGGNCMRPGQIILPEIFKKSGYNTALFGKWHLGDGEEYRPQNRGFDEVLMHGAGGIGQYSFGDFKPNATNKYFDNVLLHNDTIVQTKGFCTDLFFNAALSWIKKQHQNKQTYFAYISLNAPHGPLIAPEK